MHVQKCDQSNSKIIINARAKHKQHNKKKINNKRGKEKMSDYARGYCKAKRESRDVIFFLIMTMFTMCFGFVCVIHMILFNKSIF